MNFAMNCILVFEVLRKGEFFLEKFCMTLLLGLFSLLSPTASASTHNVGVRYLEVDVPGRSVPLKVTVWYPAYSGGRKILIGDSENFKGTEAWYEAPILDGHFPLILVSHGLGGNVAGLSWLTTALAEAGFIVAGPNHPGTTTGDATPEGTARIWERTADISAMLTNLLGDPAWGKHIDSQRVGALGYSLGGGTVLLLAGARVDLESYALYCETNKDMPDSAWFLEGKYDLRKTNQDLFEKSHHDARIQAIVAVDPSHVQAFFSQSLRDITATVHILSLGRPAELWISERPDQIAKVRPDFHYEYIDDAVHFSWLAECKKPQPPVCREGRYRTRTEIHTQGAAMVIVDFWCSWRCNVDR